MKFFWRNWKIYCVVNEMSFEKSEKQLLELTGTVKNIIFRNNTNGYTVIEIDAQGENVVAVGIMPLVSEGEGLRLLGIWKNHANFGVQFSVEALERSMPSGSVAIQRYLSSGAIKGVGEKMAKKIVDTFGDETLDIIQNQPEKLSLIQGISKAKAERISELVRKNFVFQELLTYLEKFSITPRQSIKIWKVFGESSLEKIKSDPYVICNEPILIPFENADAIAESLELPEDYYGKICAGLLYVLNHNIKNGHTCLPADKLIDATAQFLCLDTKKVNDVLDKIEEENQVVFNNFNNSKFVFTRETFCAEDYVSTRLVMMIKYPVKEIQGIENEIGLIEKKTGLFYANLQKEAIHKALSEGLLILTGGPGTGKTTTLNAIISILSSRGEKVLLAAPTGRAAQRMSQLTGFDAKTIHRLLEVEWSDEDQLRFKRNEKNLLNCDALVLDEMSMIDVTLFEKVLRALPLGCRLIMVGDSDQLPSVGAGNVLGDMIKSGIVPVVQLKEIFRQSMQSLIVTNAHRIVNGQMPELKVRTSDFFFLSMYNTQTVLDTIVDLCVRRLPKSYNYSPFSDIQVLCPSRKGVLGTVNLNTCLQASINPPSVSKNEITLGNILLREGDKVMQVRNNYDIIFEKDDGEIGSGVFNGDVGVLLKIDNEKSTLTVKFDDRKATYSFENVFDLELAYAITVHKSQGNEFEAVVMPMMCGIPQLSYRNLLYTAVTRAKSLLILVGTEKSVEKMVKNDKKTRRYSGLCEFINQKKN